MKHDVDRDWTGSGGSARRSGALLGFAVAAVVLALLVGCIACNSLTSVLREGAVRAWYLPLASFLAIVRVGARRDTRRALSLALFLLGLGALTARAYDARGADVPDAMAPMSRF